MVHHGRKLAIMNHFSKIATSDLAITGTVSIKCFSDESGEGRLVNMRWRFCMDIHSRVSTLQVGEFTAMNYG
jgi:hypothetical protein